MALDHGWTLYLFKQVDWIYLRNKCSDKVASYIVHHHFSTLLFVFRVTYSQSRSQGAVPMERLPVQARVHTLTPTLTIIQSSSHSCFLDWESASPLLPVGLKFQLLAEKCGETSTRNCKCCFLASSSELVHISIHPRNRHLSVHVYPLICEKW